MEVNVGGGGRGARGGGLTTKITRGVGVGAEGRGESCFHHRISQPRSHSPYGGPPTSIDKVRAAMTCGVGKHFSIHL